MTEYTKSGLLTGDTVTQAALDNIETQYDCAKDEYVAGNWVANVVNALRVREEKHHFKEDFIGQNVDASKWTVAVSGGICSLARGTDSDGGLLSMSSNAGGGNTCRLDFGSYRSFRHAKNCIFEAYMKLDHVTQAELLIGWYKDATHYCYFSLDCAAAAANWYCKSHNGASPNSVDSAVLANTNWVTLQIRCAAGHIYFYIDGTQVADMTTNIPTDYWEPYVLHTGTEVALKTMFIDRIELEQDY